MINQIKDFVKAHFSDIMLFIIVILLVMLAFATGYLVAKYQLKTPIQIENRNYKL
jgi:hypothetical protein